MGNTIKRAGGTPPVLDAVVVQTLAGIGFFAFLFDVGYVIWIKRRNNANGKGNTAPLVIKHSLAARFGIVALDLLICLCSVMVFTYRYFYLAPLPRLWVGTGAAVLQVVGFTIVIGGDLVLFLAYKALGVYWAYPLDGRTGKHKLVKDGPYKYIRHPVYDSFGIISTGFVLLFLDGLLLVLLVFSLIGLYVQALDEERALVSYFGEDYKVYMRQTGRFFSRHAG